MKVELSELSLDQMLDVLYVLVAESGGLKLQALDEALESPFWVERETWGQGAQAEAAHRAMMALSGGPAPKRDPSAKRPERPKPVGGEPA